MLAHPRKLRDPRKLRNEASVLKAQRVEFGAGVHILKDESYTNRFEDVHKKVKAFKDRAREANHDDAALRENRLAQEAEDLLAKENSSTRES